MVIHSTCGKKTTTVTCRYFPLEAEVHVGITPRTELYGRGRHDIRQIYHRLGDRQTKPTIFCIHCDEWRPIDEFAFSFSCQQCGAKDIEAALNVEHCRAYPNIDWVCENCVAKICTKCSRTCEEYYQYEDRFGNLIRSILDEEAE